MDFSLLRPLISSQISMSMGTSRREFKAWLASGRYQINHISEKGSEVELHVNDHEFLTESLGYDFCRFSCAAFESTRDIREDNNFPKATAWAGIRAYYAAFFAAHAILRLFGVSCSQIEASQALTLNKYATNIYDISNKISSGFFMGIFNPTTSLVTLNKLNDTHKDTWTTFDAKLEELSRSVLSVQGVSNEKAEVSAFLTALSNSLKNSGKFTSGNWLSVFRNNLNYKHDYEAWYPYKKASIRFDQANRYLSNCLTKDFNPNFGLLEPDERLRFFGTCSAIIHLLSQLSNDLSTISLKGSIHKTLTAKLIELQ